MATTKTALASGKRMAKEPKKDKDEEAREANARFVEKFTSDFKMAKTLVEDLFDSFSFEVTPSAALAFYDLVEGLETTDDWTAVADELRAVAGVLKGAPGLGILDVFAVHAHLLDAGDDEEPDFEAAIADFQDAARYARDTFGPEASLRSIVGVYDRFVGSENFFEDAE